MGKSVTGRLRISNLEVHGSIPSTSIFGFRFKNSCGNKIYTLSAIHEPMLTTVPKKILKSARCTALRVSKRFLGVFRS